METLQVLGGRLRELRKEKKLKQRELAAFLDITEVHYRRVEAGKINIPTLTLCALGYYFGVTPYFLVAPCHLGGKHYMGPLTAATGALAPAKGLVQPGCTPHFLFRLAEKKTGRARSKRKGRLGALRCSGPPRDGGRRIGACSDFALPSGTLCSSAILVTAVPWRMARRLSGWLSH